MQNYTYEYNFKILKYQKESDMTGVTQDGSMIRKFLWICSGNDWEVAIKTLTFGTTAEFKGAIPTVTGGETSTVLFTFPNSNFFTIVKYAVKTYCNNVVKLAQHNA